MLFSGQTKRPFLAPASTIRAPASADFTRDAGRSLKKEKKSDGMLRTLAMRPVAACRVARANAKLIP
jgi:hypothetical protein